MRWPAARAGQVAYANGRLVAYAALLAITRGDGAGAEGAGAADAVAAANGGSWLYRLLEPKAIAHAHIDPEYAGGIPDEALVARGGANIMADSIIKGTGTHPSGITGFSTQSAADASPEDLAQFIRHNKLGVTTAGQIRLAGGEVTSTSGWGLHATVSGLDPNVAAELFSPSIPNPVPPDLRVLP